MHRMGPITRRDPALSERAALFTDFRSIAGDAATSAAGMLVAAA